MDEKDRIKTLEKLINEKSDLLWRTARKYEKDRAEIEAQIKDFKEEYAIYAGKKYGVVQ